MAEAKPDMVTRAEAEFLANDAAEKAASAAVAQVLQALAQQRGGSGASEADMSFARALATELTGLADQGTGRKRVPPEVLERRLKAREAMIEAIVRVRESGERAQYELTAKIHLGDQLIEPVWVDTHRVQQPTRIYFSGIPNEAMVPVNAAAKEITAHFLESIGTARGTVPTRLGVTAGGHVLEALPKLPAGYEGGEFSIEGDPLKPVETPDVGYFEVVGGGAPRMNGRTIERRILGTLAKPAVELVN